MSMKTLVLVALGVALGDAVTPKIKWAQNKDTVYLTIKSACPGGKQELGIDTFSFSCQDKKWDLAFTTQGDIVPEESTCTQKRGATACTLKKSHSGEKFDQLAVEGDAPFGGKLGIDWDLYSGDGDDADAGPGGMGDMGGAMNGGTGGMGGAPKSNPFVATDALEESFKTTLANPTELDAARKEHGTVAVYAQYPWCDKCNSRHADLVGAAAKAGLFIAGLNASKQPNRALARTLIDGSGEACDYDCFVHVYSEGEDEPARLKIPYGAGEIEALLKRSMVAAVTPFDGDTSDVAAIQKDQTPSSAVASHAGSFAVGTFKDSKAAAYTAFVEACKALRTQAGGPMCLAAFGGSSSLVVHRPDGGKVEFGDFESKAELAAVRAWMGAHSAPVLRENDWSLNKGLESVGCAIGKIFLDDTAEDFDETTVEAFKAVAASLRPEIEVLWVKTSTSKYMLSDYGVPEDVALPFFGIQADASYDAAKYSLKKDGGADADDIKKFAATYLEGTLEPSRKSQPVPAGDAPDGEPNQLVWDTFNAQIKESGQETLVLLYKAWAPEDKKAKALKTFARIAEAVENTASLKGKLGVFSYDTTANYLDSDVVPTSVFSDTDDFGAFLATTAGKVKNVGSTSVRGVLQARAKKSKLFKSKKGKKKGKTEKALTKALKAVAAAETQREEAAAAAAAEAKAVLEAEFEANLKEEVDVLEAVDISGDGGVMKYVTKAAADGAKTPGTNAKVSAHYHGTTLDGAKFDSSVDRGTPFDFTLGTGGVIKCWDQGFATMKVGEKATLKCASDYAYGDAGSGAKIPGGATLRFDVELLSFTGPEAGETDLKDEL